HLDEPLYQQFFTYFVNLCRGDFGPSFQYQNRAVTEMIGAGFPITFELAIYAILYALVLGMVTGVIAALKQNTLFDYFSMSMSLAGLCVPAFLLGPLLVLVFSIYMHWLPVSGWGEAPGDKILPIITMGSAAAAYIARLSRAGMLEIFSQDFVRTAKAKGVPVHMIIIRHCLRGGLIPAIAYLGPAIAFLLTGSFVVETIFTIPGMGRFFIQAALNRDYTMILGMTILFSAMIVLFNLISDVIIFWFNPKLRSEFK
ncbi:MAG: ABC transporter permease subunit, partial [Chitinivibrionales bacterium]|nr:ABC transporter permease subunit [Chitinivibrionales bacterium]